MKGIKTPFIYLYHCGLCLGEAGRHQSRGIWDFSLVVDMEHPSTQQNKAVISLPLYDIQRLWNQTCLIFLKLLSTLHTPLVSSVSIQPSVCPAGLSAWAGSRCHVATRALLTWCESGSPQRDVGQNRPQLCCQTETNMGTGRRPCVRSVCRAVPKASLVGCFGRHQCNQWVPGCWGWYCSHGWILLPEPPPPLWVACSPGPARHFQAFVFEIHKEMLLFKQNSFIKALPLFTFSTIPRLWAVFICQLLSNHRFTGSSWLL